MLLGFILEFLNFNDIFSILVKLNKDIRNQIMQETCA